MFKWTSMGFVNANGYEILLNVSDIINTYIKIRLCISIAFDTVDGGCRCRNGILSIIFLKYLCGAVKWIMCFSFVYVLLVNKHLLSRMHAKSVFRCFCMFDAIIFFLKTEWTKIMFRRKQNIKPELFRLFWWESLQISLCVIWLRLCSWLRTNQWRIVKKKTVWRLKTEDWKHHCLTWRLLCRIFRNIYSFYLKKINNKNKLFYPNSR